MGRRAHALHAIRNLLYSIVNPTGGVFHNPDRLFGYVPARLRPVQLSFWEGAQDLIKLAFQDRGPGNDRLKEGLQLVGDIAEKTDNLGLLGFLNWLNLSD